MTAVVTHVFSVPSNREGCAEWLKAQTPDVVADVFDAARGMYAAMVNGVQESGSRNAEQEIRDLELQHSRSVEKMTKQYNDRIESLKRMHDDAVQSNGEAMKNLEVQLAEAKASVSARLQEEGEALRRKLLDEKDAEVASREEHHRRIMEQYRQTTLSQQDDLQQQHEAVVTTLRTKIVQQTEDLRRLQGESALVKEAARKEWCSEMATCVEKHREETEGLRRQLEREQERYEGDKSFWKTQIEGKDREIRDIHAQIQGKQDEITGVIRSLVGSTSAVGRLGEHFVQNVHSRMNLGTYVDDSHKRDRGFADGTWTLPFHNAPTLMGLVEMKLNSGGLDATKDLKKFEDDTRTAAQLGRVNVSIIFSLASRIAGRPRLSMDMSLGVPTVWASRDANDPLPAQALVEMGFLMMAEAWPIISRKHSDDELDAVLQGMANHIECQMVEVDRMDKVIKTVEDTARRQLRQVEDLKRVQTGLIQNVNTFRTRFPAVSSLASMQPITCFWENEGQALMTAIKEYKNGPKGKHGRNYPKDLDSLLAGVDVPQHVVDAVRSVPNAFTLAKAKLKEADDTAPLSAGGTAPVTDAESERQTAESPSKRQRRG